MSNNEFIEDIHYRLSESYMKKNFLYFSSFLFIYEILKYEIVNRIQNFFSDFNYNGCYFDKEYNFNRKSMSEKGKINLKDGKYVYAYNIREKDLIRCTNKYKNGEHVKVDIRKYRNYDSQYLLKILNESDEIKIEKITEAITNFHQKTFYTSKEDNDIYQRLNERYWNEITPKSKKNKVFENSCLWLKSNDVITEKELNDILLCRERRNYIAHEINGIVLNKTCFDPCELINIMSKIHKKISIFWIRIDPSSDEIKIDEKEITPGTSFIIDHIISIIKDSEKNHQSITNDASEKTMIKVVLRMIDKEFSIEEISDITQLPLATIEGFKKIKKIME